MEMLVRGRVEMQTAVEGQVFVRLCMLGVFGCLKLEAIAGQNKVEI